MLNGCCGAAFKGAAGLDSQCWVPRLSVLENGFQFFDGLSSAGITRTLPPAPVSACELASSSMGTTESSVSGFQSVRRRLRRV
jgi:hypothetical protein